MERHSIRLALRWFPLAQIQSGGINDYDDLGWPWDKRLKTVTIEYDTSSVNVTINLDTVSGINGSTNTQAMQQFVINGGRSKQTFAIADGTIVKLVRLRGSTGVLFKEWEYKFDYERLPADTVLFSEWVNSDYACDKIFRSLTIDIDTGGVACGVQLQIDGANAGPVIPVTTTSNDRRRILSLPSNLIGRIWRVVLTPGTGGKAQLFSVEADVIREPCALTEWDSYETGFGFDGFKIIYQVWVEYVCASTVTMNIITDTGTLAFTLPAQAQRSLYRFYVPVSVGAVLNKSKIYRIQLTSASAFKLYTDSSRFEVMPIGTDQRATAKQVPFSQAMKPTQA